jgi:hypothetical protein
VYAAKAPRLAGDTARHNIDQTFPSAETLLMDVTFDEGPGIVQGRGDPDLRVVSDRLFSGTQGLTGPPVELDGKQVPEPGFVHADGQPTATGKELDTRACLRDGRVRLDTRHCHFRTVPH